MKFKRKPKTDFYSLFAENGRNLVKASDLLAQVISEDEPERTAARNHLHDVEHAGDEITHMIMRKLNETFVTPLDRDDISLIGAKLDDCLDFMDEAADLIVLYEMHDIPKRLSKQVKVLQQCSQLTADAMERLKTLTDLKDYTVEINRLENNGDRYYRKMLAELFNSGLDAITIIKIKDIIESLEEAIDSFEQLANVIETIAMKES
ncbi:MAG: DUF47 family protein [Actinomycetaceae bacterium]|nr:DUF47 family protein [Actinomycetaceae bacterium]